MGCGTERRGLSQYSSAVPGAALHDGMLQDAAVYWAAGINRPPHGDDVSSPYASHCRAIAGGPCTRSRIRGRRQGALARTRREAPDTRLGVPRIRRELIQRRRFSALHTRERGAPNGGDPAWRIRPHDQAAPRRLRCSEIPGRHSAVIKRSGRRVPSDLNTRNRISAGRSRRCSRARLGEAVCRFGGVDWGMPSACRTFAIKCDAQFPRERGPTPFRLHSAKVEEVGKLEIWETALQCGHGK